MDLPITMGICRRCSKLKIYGETTLDGTVLRRVYYCRKLMHEVSGCDTCNDFTDKEMNE